MSQNRNVTDANPPHGDSNLVWHYTSLSTLVDILKGRSFRATEVRFQNDPHEARSARNALSELLKKAAATAGAEVFARYALQMFDAMHAVNSWEINDEGLQKNSRYVLCASLDDDNLYAWRTYGSVGTIGCAIGLDRRKPLGIVGQLVAHTDAWANVTYTSEDLEREFLPTFQDFANEWVANIDPRQETPQNEILMPWLDRLWPAIRSRAKHPSYREEQEARITLHAPDTDSVSFSDGRFGPRPYVSLGRAKTWGEGSTRDELLPIRCLRLAPDAPRAAFESARWILAMNGYPIDGKLVEPHYNVDDSDKVPVLESRHAYRKV